MDSNFTSPLLKRFLYFLIKPDQFEEKTISVKGKIFSILKMISWAYFISITLSVALGILIQSNGSVKNSLSDFLSQSDIFSVIILGMFVSPFLEETTFRLPLRFKPIYLSLSLFIIFKVVVDIVLTNTNINYNTQVIISWLFPLITSIILYFMFNIRVVFNFLTMIYGRFFIVVFYFLTLSFALLHITNYTDFGTLSKLLIPTLVIPQLVAGFILGFVRIKYGYLYSFITHMLYNGILLIAVVFTMDTKITILNVIGYLVVLIVVCMFFTGAFSLLKESVLTIKSRK